MKALILLCLVAACVAQELPDAPQPQPVKVERVKPNFWTFRKGPDAPILRTNREMFKSKLYVASLVGGAVAMVVACRNKRSGEDWASEVPAVAGVDAMSYLMGRFFAMPLAVGPQAYEIVHYSIAAAK